MRLWEMLENNRELLTKNIFISSKGGSGKTESLKKLNHYLCDHCVKTSNGKTVIPIFIDIKQYSGGENYIFSVIHSAYLSNCLSENDDYVETICSLLFEAPESAYHYVVIIDGLNEVDRTDVFSRNIKRLSEAPNSSVILSSRFYDVNLSFNIDLTKLEMQPLSVETVLSDARIHGKSETEIRELLEGMDQREKEMLSSPFYLKIYIDLLKTGICGDSSTKYDFLSVYTDKWLKVNYRGELDANEMFDSVLPVLSVCMAEYRTLLLTGCDSNPWKKMRRYIEPADYKAVMGFFVNRGIFVSESDERGSYRFSHNIYRDYFVCRYYINLPSYQAAVVPDLDVDKENLSMYLEKCDLHPELLFSDNEDENKVFIVGLSNFFNADAEFDFSQLSGRLFAFSNILENAENTAKWKNKVLALAMFDSFRRDVFLKSEERLYILSCIRDLAEQSGDDQLTSCKADLLFALGTRYIEICRRSGNYKEGLDQIIWFKDNLDKYFINLTIRDKSGIVLAHNMAKILIYRAFGKAVETDGYSEEAAKDYEAGFELLKYCSDNGFVLSTNLYYQMFEPDPISLSYIEAFLPAPENRQYTSANAYLKLFNDNKNKPGWSYWYFPLSKVISALMHFVNIEEYEGNVVCFTTGKPENKKRNMEIADHLIDEYFIKKNVQNSSCKSVFAFKGMILQEQDPSRIEEISSWYIRSGLPLARFLNIITTGKTDYDNFDKLCRALIGKLVGRTPDSYDFIYIRQDILDVWTEVSDETTRKRKFPVFHNGDERLKLLCGKFIEWLRYTEYVNFDLIKWQDDKEKMIADIYLSRISDLLFIDKPVESAPAADMVMLLGSTICSQTAQMVNEIKRVNKISDETVYLVTGAHGSRNADVEIQEWEQLKEGLLLSGIPEEKILCEKEARSGKDNFAFSVPLINANGGFDRFRNIIVVCKPFFTKRCALYAEKYAYPKPFFVGVKEPSQERENITADNWYSFEYGRTRVMEEIWRLFAYSDDLGLNREDIEFISQIYKDAYYVLISGGFGLSDEEKTVQKGIFDKISKILAGG